MRIKDYIKSRIILVVGWFFVYFFTFLIICLSINVMGIKEDLLYAFLFMLLITCMTFYLDYRREKKKVLLLHIYERKPQLLLEEPVRELDSEYMALLQDIYRHYYEKELELQHKQKDYQDFITSWIHDMKIPISVLKMGLEQDTPLRMEEKESFLEELEKMEEYLTKILYFIKIDDFHNDYIPVMVPLHRMVKKELKNFSKVFGYKKIKLHLEPLKEEVLTDEKWTSFIIHQILSNAVKYTNVEGEITISSSQNEKGIYLSFTNTGEGIKKADLTRVFNRGFTGYTGHQENQSTGYGLYLSKNLADKLNHQIFVSSHYGTDTTFTIFFPKVNDYHIH